MDSGNNIALFVFETSLCSVSLVQLTLKALLSRILAA
jgi:hypothetical protein